jgi:Bacterial regulatory proteins, gntR family
MVMARDSLVDSIRAELSEIAGLDAASARIMPAAFYTSPEFLELEEEHLLRHQWLCVGHIGEIAQPGGVSAMPVREALKRLEAEKALTGAAKRAYRVADMTPARAADLFHIQSILEGAAA